MPGVKMILDLDPQRADALRQAASKTGVTPEALAAEAVAQVFETALRHKVLVERMESVDAQMAAIARFVEEATTAGGAGESRLEFGVMFAL